MAKSVELTEKELKDVSGGAYIEDGYLYFQFNGKNKKQKIVESEEIIKSLVETLTKQGYNDEEICARLVYVGKYLGVVEDC